MALEEYRRKRSADRTPEPFGGEGEGSGCSFVVQKHAARQLHYDFRLEHEGVLLSWAVPKGASRNPADKHVAIHVEDHPIEYADFEGIIPEGNYGAGAVIVWDRGVYVPLEDIAAGIAKGKLLFELRGHKLKGRWTLVKIKKSEKDWLLIKERDGHIVSENGTDFPQGSVLSGLTVEQLGAGYDPAEAIRAELTRLKCPRGTIDVADLDVMLAESRDKPFTRDGWLFELKYDGYRIVADREFDVAQLFTRNHNDATATFPEIAYAVSRLPFERLVLDGEAVVLDQTGRPSFQLLQQRGRFLRPIDARRAATRLPAVYYAFDLLAFEEFDLRSLPLIERKRILQMVLPEAGTLRPTEHIETRGVDFYEAVRQLGLEGIVAKKADSKYRAGRSSDWLKLRIDRTGDFVIVGYSPPKNSRTGFGALHLGAYRDGELHYAGSVGTGFTLRQLSSIQEMLDQHRRAKKSFTGDPPGKGHTWIEPLFVCEVRYKEWTFDNYLRHPVFLRLRDDKPASECIDDRDNSYLGDGDGDGDNNGLGDGDNNSLGDGDGDGEELQGNGADERSSSSLPSPSPSPSPDSVPPSPSRKIRFTNPDKVFFPEHGYTKSDLIEYYRAIGPWLLPWLKDRPVVLTRYPDGIGGKSFFQKDAPGFTPEWVRTVSMWSEESQREISHFVCDDEDTLLYLANSGTIPLHVWSSRASSLNQPDWCILDLDPKDAPFSSVIEAARVTHALCEGIGLPAYLKTSGSSGLHVLVPLGGQVTHEQSRVLAELLARAVVAEASAITTVERVVSKRQGRVYVDYLQNGYGKLLVSPFCVRPLPGAPVSMPLAWDDLTDDLDIRDFTIANAPGRMRAHGDPNAELLQVRPDLLGALGRLQQRL